MELLAGPQVDRHNLSLLLVPRHTLQMLYHAYGVPLAHDGLLHLPLGLLGIGAPEDSAPATIALRVLSVSSNLDQITLDVHSVYISGYVPEQEVQVERSRKQTVVKKSVKKIEANASDNDKLFIHILVTNALDGQEIGESKIELDELIDPNLADLAKEFCVCLNRSHLIDSITQKKIIGKSTAE